jgi:hypothetical protein
MKRKPTARFNVRLTTEDSSRNLPYLGEYTCMSDGSLVRNFTDGLEIKNGIVAVCGILPHEVEFADRDHMYLSRVGTDYYLTEMRVTEKTIRETRYWALRTRT